MHELSISQNIVDIVKSHASKYHAKKVTEIIIDIGEVSGIEKTALEFALEILVKNTFLQDTKIIINIIPGKARCSSCGNIFPVHDFISQCSNCGNIYPEIIQGKNLKVKSITVN
ncbi:MAG: hydrogenase maturation nickel metallochaperone HypA [Bacteroidota bacterium]